jgi:hypothetical protein
LFKQAYIIGKVLDGEIPDVYVQSSKYWEKHAKEIRDYFRTGITKGDDRIALHIRRGDYLKADHFHTNLWNTDYYQRAVQLFPGEKFLVFCRDRQSREQDADDYDWCKENIGSLGIEFEMAITDSEVDDLNLMASCKGLIGANSTFSWWAAFLGNHERVVFPKQWFQDGVQRTELLPEWIQL